MPPYWKKFIEAAGLIGKESELPASVDRSGIGGWIEWLSEEHSREEKELNYPGIAVAELGYIPVGGGDGTGDPYFIRESDGEGGPLYRIYHEHVFADGSMRDDAIVVVLADYRTAISLKVVRNDPEDWRL